VRRGDDHIDAEEDAFFHFAVARRNRSRDGRVNAYLRGARSYPGMHWGDPASVGHFLDLISALIGMILFPIGYLLHSVTLRCTQAMWNLILNPMVTANVSITGAIVRERRPRVGKGATSGAFAPRAWAGQGDWHYNAPFILFALSL
jgi:hypothetical protein